MYLEAVKRSCVRVSVTPSSASASEQLGTLRSPPGQCADPGSGHLTTEAERDAGRYKQTRATDNKRSLCLAEVGSAVEVHINMP